MRIAATVELNLESPCGFRGEGTEESAHAAASGRGPRCGRILIMDDEPLVREMMHRQLAICGYEVTAAVHGEDAVNAYSQSREAGRPFDAVILDLLIPNGWGGERTLAELLRLDPEVKALVCSGTLDGPRAHYEKKGFRGVLGKPFTLRSCAGSCKPSCQPDCRRFSRPLVVR
jgi:CheY-like chemotaxis protein